MYALSLLPLLVVALIAAAAADVPEWEDSEMLSAVWNACSRHDTTALNLILQANPDVAFHRASDGRGPLFWAYEFADTDAIEILEGLGLEAANMLDKDDKTPLDIGKENEELNKEREFPGPSPMPDMNTDPNSFQNQFDVEEDPFDDEEDEEEEEEEDEDDEL